MLVYMFIALFKILNIRISIVFDLINGRTFSFHIKIEDCCSEKLLDFQFFASLKFYIFKHLKSWINPSFDNHRVLRLLDAGTLKSSAHTFVGTDGKGKAHISQNC